MGYRKPSKAQIDFSQTECHCPPAHSTFSQEAGIADSFSSCGIVSPSSTSSVSPRRPVRSPHRVQPRRHRLRASAPQPRTAHPLIALPNLAPPVLPLPPSRHLMRSATDRNLRQHHPHRIPQQVHARRVMHGSVSTTNESTRPSKAVPGGFPATA